MYSDVGYQQQLLHLVGHLYTHHVLPGRPPDKKTFTRSAEVAALHRDFVRKTIELAAASECVLESGMSGCSTGKNGAMEASASSKAPFFS
jgi:hypothetical protein